MKKYHKPQIFIFHVDASLLSSSNACHGNGHGHGHHHDKDEEDENNDYQKDMKLFEF